MLFSRIVSCFAFSLALGGLTLAKPVAEKPDLAVVHNTITILKSSTDTILPQLKNMAANKNITRAAAVPLMNQLIAAVNNAHFSLVNVPRSIPTALEKRQNISDIAALIAEVIEEISTVLEDLLVDSAAIPILGALIPELDAALTTLVTGLGALVTGLVTTVGALLSAVSAVLDSVGLGLLLSILGLATV